MKYEHGVTPEYLRLLLGGFRAGRTVSAAAQRNPHGMTQGKLSARPMVLTDQTRSRGGADSRRRRHRVWAPR